MDFFRKIFVLIVFSLFVTFSIIDFLNLVKSLPKIEKPKFSFELPKIEEFKKEKISLPPPLRVEKLIPESFLSKEEIIFFTNKEREKNGLPLLKENNQLNETAFLKLEEMFSKQYFAHYSPEGESVSDLAKKIGYQFLMIGENLALGNFQDSQSLVEAWLKSPDHRANILNPYYQEIGVAVKKGLFEGKKVWLAVQHFALPLSVCPQPEESLKIKIQNNKNEIDSLYEEISNLKREIQTQPRFRPEEKENYLQKVEKYNHLVSKYNSLLEETQNLIEKYNQEVESFNKCIESYKK